MAVTINCYFNEKSYYFTDDNAIFAHWRLSSEDKIWQAYQSYSKSYLVLLDMLSSLKHMDIKNVRIHHDSRIIEEVLGKIDPINEWSRGVIIYIHRNLLPYFIDYSFVKGNSEDIKVIVDEGEQIINATRPVDCSSLLYKNRKRRVQKFKDEYRKRRKEQTGSLQEENGCKE